MLMKYRGILIAFAVVAAGAAIAALWLGGSLDRASHIVTPVRYQLSWVHNGAFAGYYASDQRGYYAQEGLAVQFIEGGPRLDPVAGVIEGRAELGSANASLLIKARSEGKPVRAIAVLHRRNPVVFMTLRQSGITHPSQFAGKTIRVARQNIPILRAVMNRFKIEPDQYELVHSSDLESFYSGEIDVYAGWLFDVTNKIQASGHEINIIHPDDFGIHHYDNSIFTTERFMAENPELIARFLKATLKLGWVYAVRNPDAAGPMTAVYDPDVDVAHESAWLKELLPLINTTGEDSIGWMEPEIWAAMTENLGRMGVLDKPIDPTEVYTMRFLRQIRAATE